MRDHSDDFAAAIFRSHRRVTRVEVLAGGSTQAVLACQADTSVDVDGTAPVRRRATIPLIDRTGALVPGAPSDLLYPAGNELRIWRGIDFGDDRAGEPDGIAPRGCELVPSFTGPLFENDSEYQPAAGIAMSLDCYDRGRLIAENRWTDPYPIAAGTAWHTAIADAVRDRLPHTLPVAMTGIATTTYTTPLMVAGVGADSDPLADLVRWAESFGHEFFFDALGNPILRPIPDGTTGQPVLTYQPGQHHGTLKITKRLSREEIYNGLVVTGEAADGAVPVRAVAWDTDPASPTFADGKFGRRPRFLTSELITTQAQADAAALAGLNQRLGAAETITVTGMVHPALEEGDLVAVELDTLRIDARYLLDAFPIPLAADGTQDLAVRKRRAG